MKDGSKIQFTHSLLDLNGILTVNETFGRIEGYQILGTWIHQKLIALRLEE